MKLNIPFSVLIFSAMLTMTATSCRHEPMMVIDEGPGPGGPGPTPQGHPCDPDSVYFELEVLPIFRSNCAMSGCHDAATASDGVVLTDFSSVLNSGELEPYDLDSDIYEMITENDPDDRMPPPPMARLSQEQITTIRNWILQGAKNNSCDPDFGGCSTDNVTFSGTVFPTLQTNCVGCHRPGTLNGGVDLSSYNGVKTVAANGKLAGVIQWQSGYVPMPFGGNKLPDCTIDQITAWISAGAPNN